MPLSTLEHFEPLPRRPRRTAPDGGVRPFMPPVPTPPHALRARWTRTAAFPLTFGARLLRRLFATWQGLCTLAAVGLVAGGLAAGYQFLVHSPYFDVVDVVVTGGRPDLQQELLQLTGLQGRYGVNLLLLPADDLRARLARHPRVASIDVQKHYPGTLVVDVAERRPAAIVLGSVPYLVDRAGIVMGPVAAGEWTRTAHLPAMTGVDEVGVELGQPLRQRGARGALRLWDAALRVASPLVEQVGEIHLAGEDRLELVLRDGGVRVLLEPEPDGVHLAALEELLARPGALDGVETLDLRFGGVAVARHAPPPPPPPPASRRPRA